VQGVFEDVWSVTRLLKVLPKDFGGSESMCTLLRTRRCGGTLQIFMHVAKKSRLENLGVLKKNRAPSFFLFWLYAFLKYAPVVLILGWRMYGVYPKHAFVCFL
jgi:hypothetical protein